MTTYNVTTSTFSSTLTSAVNGDILILADGNYGDLTRRRDWGHHQNSVTIQAENRWGPKFTTGYFQINNLTLDGVEFTGTPRLYNCNNCTWLNVKQGYSTINDACDSLLFKYCWFTGFQQTQSSGPSSVSTNITYDCCCFKYEQSIYSSPPTPSPSWGDDWIQMQNTTDVVIQNCTFWDQYAYWNGVNDADRPHLDVIQIFQNGATPARITIQDNWVWDSTATWGVSTEGCQGFNLTGYDYLVRGNIIATTQVNSFRIDDVSAGDTGSIYEENLLVSGPQTAPYTGGNFSGGVIYGSAGGVGIIRNSVCTSVINAGSYTVSGVTTGVTGAAHLDWTTEGAAITDYVPNTSGPADVSQRWRTRLDAIIAGTADFFDPGGYDSDPVLHLADAEPSAPSIPGTPTINGTLNVGQTITFTASGPVTGSPTPTRTWEVYNTVSGLVQDSSSNSYLLDASDQGDGIYVIQREENTEGSDTAQSATTAAIGAALAAPAGLVFFPADNATGVSVDATFTVQFDQNIQFGTGDIKLWRAGQARETWNVVLDPGGAYHLLSITGDTLTFGPHSNMFEADYWITIDPGAIVSASTGAAYPGLSDETTWNFSTVQTPTGGRSIFSGSKLLLTAGGLPLLTS